MQAGDPQRIGPMLRIAQHVQPDVIRLLWTDAQRMPLDRQAEYVSWLKDKLRESGQRVTVHVHTTPRVEEEVSNFAWVYKQIQPFVENYDPKTEHIMINASGGTSIMTAAWIVAKKSLGNMELFISSVESGVQPLELPPALDIRLDEFFGIRPSKLMQRLNDGDIRLNTAFDTLITNSTRFKEALLQSQAVARFKENVLIVGAPGTGKSVLAQAIHDASGREGDFISVDCGSLIDEVSIRELYGWKKDSFTGANGDRKGLIKEAENGTIFLDEIGNAPPDVQKDLLHFLQTGRIRPLGQSNEEDVNARVITATNANLRSRVLDGTFRQDLHDRLSTFVIKLPSLQERPKDIMLLAEGLLQRINDKHREIIEADGGAIKHFGTGVERSLKKYAWPGNVRELENMITRLVILGDPHCNKIAAADIEAELSQTVLEDKSQILGRPLGEGFVLEAVLDEVQRHYVRRALLETDGNRSKTERLLGLSRTKLRGIMQKNIIDVP